jgi:hypothetical protein
MTAAFEDRLNILAKSNSKVFVSNCNLSDGAREKAILIFPLGSLDGTIALFSNGNEYNGAEVSIVKGLAVLEDPGGGEWSQKKLTHIVNELLAFPFALLKPEQVMRIVNQPGTNTYSEPVSY